VDIVHLKKNPNPFRGEAGPRPGERDVAKTQVAASAPSCGADDRFLSSASRGAAPEAGRPQKTMACPTKQL
jgi:hypothetical protein